MPLDRSCSQQAFRANVRTERDGGKEIDQAIAISYSILKKSCGVTSKEMMKPSEIIASGKKTESLDEMRQEPGISMSAEEKKIFAQVSKLLETAIKKLPKETGAHTIHGSVTYLPHHPEHNAFEVVISVDPSIDRDGREQAVKSIAAAIDKKLKFEGWELRHPGFYMEFSYDPKDFGFEPPEESYSARLARILSN